MSLGRWNQSSVVGGELLNDLPLNGCRFLDFALLVPNANPDGQDGLGFNVR